MQAAGGTLLRWADIAATFVFALEGAAVAAHARVDVFGALVIAFTTALVGGIVRDLLLGEAPPAALRSQEYALVAFVGAGAIILFDQLVAAIPFWLITGLDAAGLGLFAVTGASKALDYQIKPLIAVLLGVVTAVGGGVARDVLLNELPAVLFSHIYAVAALAGAGVVVIGAQAKAPRPAAMAVGALLCFGIRVVSVWQNWNLPRLSPTHA